MRYKKARWKLRLGPDELTKLQRGSRRRGAFALKNFKDLSRHGDKFPLGGEGNRFVPKDKKILEKMGLRKGERVHFFVAYSGDWAKELANRGINVHASDVSERAVKYLKSKPGRIRQVTRMPAGYGPIVPNYYDWSISFEPYPAVRPPRLQEDALRMGLINKKGLKMIFWGVNITFWRGGYKRAFEVSSTDEDILQRMNRFARLYGAKAGEKRINLNRKAGVLFGVPSFSTEARTKADMRMFTMETTPEARRKAELDLYVERRKYSRTGTQGELVKKLAKEFKVSEQEIRESLKRIRETEKIGLLTVG